MESGLLVRRLPDHTRRLQNVRGTMSERAKNLAEKALEIFRDCLHNAGDYWIEDELAISRIQKLIEPAIWFGESEQDDARFVELLEHAYNSQSRDAFHAKHDVFAQSECRLCCSICATLGYPVQD